MSDLFDQLIETYFESHTELLPDGAVEAIKQGKTVEIVTIPGANQLDIGSIVELLIAVLTLANTVLLYLQDKDYSPSKSELKAKIEDEFPVIVQNLEGEELDAFVDDLMKR